MVRGAWEGWASSCCSTSERASISDGSVRADCKREEKERHNTWIFSLSSPHTFCPGCTGVPTTFPSAVQPWCWKSRELDKMERCMQERMWEAPRLLTSEC